MQIIKRLTKLLFFICPVFATAQTTYLQQGDKAFQLLERLEIKAQTNANLNYSNIKPFSRRVFVKEVEAIDSINKLNPASLTKTDQYNLQRFLMNNSEWVSGSTGSFKSRKPILNAFYKTQPNLYEVNIKDFFLAINPVLQISVSKESGNTESLFLNSRGITLRGRIANKIGFSTTITDNQERGPQYFQSYVNKYRAVPGVGFYKGFMVSSP